MGKEREMDRSQDSFMKTEPVFRLLLKMGLPMMFSMLVNSLFNIVDSMYIASLGTDALTAISLIYPMQNLIIALAVGLGVGINAALAKKLGEWDPDGANLATGNGLTMDLVLCLFFLLLGLFGVKPYVSFFTDNQAVYDYAVTYGMIVMSLACGNTLAIYMEKVFQAVGRMVETMTCLIIGAVLNIILDPILIFGWLGAPRMDIAGAAVATVFSQFVTFFAYFVFMRKKALPVQFRRKDLRLNKETAERILTVGAPASLTNLLPSVTSSVLNKMLVSYSEVYVAILGIYYKIQTFFYLPSSGLIQGMRPILAYNDGAGEIGRVRQTIRYAMFIILAIMTAGLAIMLFLPDQVMWLFQAESDLLEAGRTALRIISLGFIPSVIGVVACGAFEGLGRGGESLIVSSTRLLIFILIFAAILIRPFGPVGVWMAWPCSEVLSAVIAWILLSRFLKRLRKKPLSSPQTND